MPLNNLVKCPDCGADVSRHAAACPKCGRPISFRRSFAYNVGMGVIAAFLLLGILGTCNVMQREPISNGGPSGQGE